VGGFWLPTKQNLIVALCDLRHDMPHDDKDHNHDPLPRSARKSAHLRRPYTQKHVRAVAALQEKKMLAQTKDNGKGH